MTANTPLDVTVDLSTIDNPLITLDIIVQAPTIGHQYVTLRRTDSNKYRIMSTVAQDVTFTALVLTK